jgi:hypothetical protein
MWRHSLYDERRCIKLRNVCDIPPYISKIAGIITNKPNLAQLHITD